MNSALQQKLNALEQSLRGMRSVLVAYSGGVDSALVLAVARQALGERSLGCIGVSPSYPQRELRAAVTLAEQIGARYRIIEPAEHLDARYSTNAADRCFFCKNALFGVMKQIAQDEGWNFVLDGTHLDDVGDHVHGMRAAQNRHVRSPFLELRFGKNDVRELARAIGLPVWNKPAMACLASRVPHGTAITPQLLRQIEQAEDVLADAGFRQFRVRHHGELARIELAGDEMERALQLRHELASGIQRAGYRYISLDLVAFHESPGKPTDAPVQLRILSHA